MHLCFVKKNNNKKTILSISDFCQQTSPVQVGILPGTKWRQMREYAFAKARGTCAISQGRCVSWNTAKLYRPNQIGLSGTISIRSRSLSGELPLRRVRARLLRVHLRRRLPRIQVPARGPFLSQRFAYRTRIRRLVFDIRHWSILSPTGGVSSHVGVWASGSFHACPFLPAVAHSEAKGQVALG